MADNNVTQWTDTSRVETADLQRWEDGANKANCLEKQIPELIAAHNTADGTHEDIRALANKKVSSLVFDTKDHLMSWLNKNLCPFPEEGSSTFGIITLNGDGTFDYTHNSGNSSGTRPVIFTIPAGTYTISTNIKSVRPYNSIQVKISIGGEINYIDDTYSFTITESKSLKVSLDFDDESIDYTDFSVNNVRIQVENGNTATEFVPYTTTYIREDGVIKDDLKSGDLLLVEESGVSDYWWNGATIVPTEVETDQSYDPNSGNAQSGKAVSEAVETEQKRAESTFSNALKGNKSGSAILVDDVSPVTQEMGVKVSSDTVTDLTAVKVIKCGKNLFDKNMPFDDSTKAPECNWTAYFIQLQPNTTYYCTVFNPQISYSIMLLSSNTTINGPTSKSLAISHVAGEEGFATWGTQKALTTGSTGKLYIGTFLEPAKVAECIQKCNLQIELGNTGTEYEPYITPTEYTPNADGTVEGITSLYPTTMLSVNADYIPLHTKPADWETNYTDYYEYNSDTGKYSKLSIQTENTKSMMEQSSVANLIGGIYAIESVVKNDPIDGLASIYFSEYTGGAPMVSNEDADAFEAGQYVYFEVTEDSSAGTVTGSISTLIIPEFVTDMYYIKYNGGVIIDCDYNVDINKAFEKLQQAIISLGGNV